MRGQWEPSRPRSSYSEIPQSNFHLKGRQLWRLFFTASTFVVIGTDRDRKLSEVMRLL